ncbi:ADAM9 protein, partial [Todus mexicanus]|nr:ADAM9 protein [Todus mexicanus]
PSWVYASYEIVIPRKLSPRAGEASQDQASYIISAQGVNYTIRLRRKDFVIKTFPVFTRDSRGDIVAEPHTPADCYYQGYVDGFPGSAVTLRTCSGLSGLLQIGSYSYSIQPLAASSTAEHLLLRGEQAIPGKVIYKTPPEAGRFPAPGAGLGQLQPGGRTRYLELLVVVDREGFDAFGRSVAAVTLEVVEIINLVDGLFSAFRLRVVLTALEVWVGKNPIRVTENIEETLENFNLWRKRTSVTYALHDVGCLFASLDFADVAAAAHAGGKSNFASACSRRRAAAVVSFARWPPLDTAVQVARALGYLLGMEHGERYCGCGNTSKCIMSAHGPVSYQFSNCSRKHYSDFLASGQGFCLNNVPKSAAPFVVQRCGNGVLDAGEECDCGAQAHCELDQCCDSNCRKKKGALCASGGCCKNCKPLLQGEVCRESAGPCDLPEYCNGTSEHCPADVAKQDGTACAEDGLCYSGECQSRTLQCRRIFGKEAKPAPLLCFQEVNVKGDGFGSCRGAGADVGSQHCTLENALCGRMQCTNTASLPQLEEHTTIIQIPVGDTWCWGTNYHLSVESRDAGVVKDGTRCGEKKICINWTCVPEESYLTSRCSAERTCGGKGVCNSRGNCHCDNGWAPPHCQAAGFGGSVDSGPAPAPVTALFRLILRYTTVTTAILVLAAGVMRVRKLRGTQAFHRHAGCFWARRPAPEEDVKGQ